MRANTLQPSVGHFPTPGILHKIRAVYGEFDCTVVANWNIRGATMDVVVPYTGVDPTDPVVKLEAC